MNSYLFNYILRMIKGVIGIVLIMIGPMLIVIPVDDTVLLKNICLRIFGVVCILMGVNLVHRQFHPNQYKK